MKNDKITITYTRQDTIECWPPHSKLMLMVNIFRLFVIGIAFFFIGMLGYVVTILAPQDPNNKLFMTLCLGIIGVIYSIPLYDTYSIWKNGSGYERAKKFVALNDDIVNIKQFGKKINILN